MMSNKLGIIGLGKVGKLIGNIFDEKFNAYDIVKIKGYEKLICTLKKLIVESKVIFVSVPDDKIGSVVKKISKLNLRLTDKIFIHTSGSHSIEILKPLTEMGAHSGSMHPAISVVDREWILKHLHRFQWTAENLKDFPGWFINAIEKKNIKITEIRSEYKLPYHIACTLLSNLPVFNPEMAMVLLNKIEMNETVKKRIGMGLLTSLEHNMIEIKKDIITGPIARGDAGTLKLHMEYLRTYPQIQAWLKQKVNLWIDTHKNVNMKRIKMTCSK